MVTAVTAPAPSVTRTGTRRRCRLLVATALLGLALAAAPVAFQMFTRAPKGAQMLAEFKPFMTSSRLSGYQGEIAEIDAAVHQLTGIPAAQRDATYQSFAAQWPQIRDEMNWLLSTVQANRGNYRAVAALPSFRLFPWFFLLPGVIVAAGAGVALWRPGAITPVRVVLVAVGVGLVLAPVVFQMFTRAPKGGQMMTAFRSLETTQEVQQIQGYFATMALGQGEIRLHLEPALHHGGQSLAAIANLDHDWVHILNDMTPMIGAMSDNVDNYAAIKALPPFPLFPWFFVIPGALVAGLALATRPSTEGKA